MSDMPKVTQCEATDCAYNVEKVCHAMAITMSSGSEPECLTYLSGQKKGGDQQTVGKVGACKAEHCEYNQNLECHAPGISVGQKESDEASCLTFEVRQPVSI